MEPPSDELPAVDPELFERAREAVTAIRGKGRRPNGQGGRGNMLNLRHGLKSRLLLEQADVSTWHREQVEAITADLGGDVGLSALARASVREAARLEVILAALGDGLLMGGVLTAKGKTRAATGTYLRVLDRFTRMVSTLGLSRRTRDVLTLDAAGYIEAQRAPGGRHGSSVNREATTSDSLKSRDAVTPSERTEADAKGTADD